MSGEAGLRIDAWLWRARFFKTRSQATKFVDARRGAETRLDKASRTIKPGDILVFAVGGRLIAVCVEDLGERRGPPAEAACLYRHLENN